MAHTPASHHDTADMSSADDMRQLGPIGMLAGAIIAILAIMAIVYVPQMWGIERFGSDVTGTSATGGASTEQVSPTGGH